MQQLRQDLAWLLKPTPTAAIDVNRDKAYTNSNGRREEKRNGREITGGIQIDYTRGNVKIMQMSFTSEWDPRDERGYN